MENSAVTKKALMAIKSRTNNNRNSMSRLVRGVEALAVRKTIKLATIRLVAGNQQKQ
jgi:hypothetical protein